MRAPRISINLPATFGPNSAAGERPRIRVRCDRDAGARHRRQHGRVHGREIGPARCAALHGCRSTRTYSWRQRSPAQERGPLSAGTVDEIAARQQSFTLSLHLSMSPSRLSMAARMAPRSSRSRGSSRILRHARRVTSAGANVSQRRRGQRIGGAQWRRARRGYGFAVMLSHGAWARLFGTDATVIGREVRINGIPRTVIGVLPPAFIARWGMSISTSPSIEGLFCQPGAVRRSQWLGLVVDSSPA